MQVVQGIPQRYESNHNEWETLHTVIENTEDTLDASGNQTAAPATSTQRKANLVIIASPRSRDEPNSSLLRLIRDYAEEFKQHYIIHSTKWTGQVILSTGLFEKDVDVFTHRAGADGGLAELAAFVARGECLAVIALLDPADPYSDAIENWALKRLTIEKKIRLITTRSAAERWFVYEAGHNNAKRPIEWKPNNWENGIKNADEKESFLRLKLGERTLALISHDNKKDEMVKFVNGHLETLAQHHRILTTGTTGWLLKLIFAGESQTSGFLHEIRTTKVVPEKRIAESLAKLLSHDKWQFVSLEDLLADVRRRLQTRSNDEFTSKIMPLPSGPDGGDVLIANEVLNHQCHTMVFFQDPLTAHPHEDDIRLLEHTAQLPGVFAECVSDEHSAEEWMKGLDKELGDKDYPENVAQTLRRKYNLREAILVPIENETDSEVVGERLARACAGYFHQYLSHILRNDLKDRVRVGISWGWSAVQVLKELENLSAQGLIEKKDLPYNKLVWSPLIGIVSSEIEAWEANIIAEKFRAFYGGTVEGLSCAGFAKEEVERPKQISDTIAGLEESDLILTSASPWGKSSPQSLAIRTALDRGIFPELGSATGNISAIFLDPVGKELKLRQGYSIVGLGYEGFQRAARAGVVILICGGANRHEVALSALRGNLASVLVTTNQTAHWILENNSGD